MDLVTAEQDLFKKRAIPAIGPVDILGRRRK